MGTWHAVTRKTLAKWALLEGISPTTLSRFLTSVQIVHCYTNEGSLANESNENALTIGKILLMYFQIYPLDSEKVDEKYIVSPKEALL